MKKYSFKYFPPAGGCYQYVMIQANDFAAAVESFFIEYGRLSTVILVEELN